MKTRKWQLGGEPWGRMGGERETDSEHILASKKEIHREVCQGQSIGDSHECLCLTGLLSL